MLLRSSAHGHGLAMAMSHDPAVQGTEQASTPHKHDLPTSLTLPVYPEQNQRIGTASLTGGLPASKRRRVEEGEDGEGGARERIKSVVEVPRWWCVRGIGLVSSHGGEFRRRRQLGQRGRMARGGRQCNLWVVFIRIQPISLSSTSCLLACCCPRHDPTAWHCLIFPAELRRRQRTRG